MVDQKLCRIPGSLKSKYHATNLSIDLVYGWCPDPFLSTSYESTRLLAAVVGSSVEVSLCIPRERLFVIELEKVNAVFFLLGLADYLVVSLEWSTTRCQPAKALEQCIFLNFTY